MKPFVSSLDGSHKASRGGPPTSGTDTSRHESAGPSYTTPGDSPPVSVGGVHGEQKFYLGGRAGKAQGLWLEGVSMRGMGDHKMPGRTMPTWAIATLVIGLTVFFALALFGLYALFH